MAVLANATARKNICFRQNYRRRQTLSLILIPRNEKVSPVDYIKQLRIEIIIDSAVD